MTELLLALAMLAIALAQCWQYLTIARISHEVARQTERLNREIKRIDEMRRIHAQVLHSDQRNR
jgi:type II secretory pathway component PulJ